MIRWSQKGEYTYVIRYINDQKYLTMFIMKLINNKNKGVILFYVHAFDPFSLGVKWSFALLMHRLFSYLRRTWCSFITHTNIEKKRVMKPGECVQVCTMKMSSVLWISTWRKKKRFCLQFFFVSTPEHDMSSRLKNMTFLILVLKGKKSLSDFF